ncbi:MAG: hypothetical protein WCI20_13890, partial [bacterium]
LFQGKDGFHLVFTCCFKRLLVDADQSAPAAFMRGVLAVARGAGSFLKHFGQNSHHLISNSWR